MKQYYKKAEQVVEILDELLGVNKYVFSSFGGTAEGKLSGSLKGNGSAFVKAHASTDRRSDFIYVNPMRILAYKNVTVAVPADILTSISTHADTVDSDTETVDSLEEDLNRYFELR